MIVKNNKIFTRDESVAEKSEFVTICEGHGRIIRMQDFGPGQEYKLTIEWDEEYLKELDKLKAEAIEYAQIYRGRGIHASWFNDNEYKLEGDPNNQGMGACSKHMRYAVRGQNSPGTCPVCHTPISRKCTCGADSVGSTHSDWCDKK